MPAQIPQLMRQLHDFATYAQATSALLALGSQAVEPLLAALRSPEQADRALALSVLARMHDPSLVPAFIAHSTQDPVPVVRSDAVQALVAFPTDPRVPDFLLHTARNGAQDVLVRMTAIRALGTVQGEETAKALWVELLRDPSPAMVMHAAHQLGTSRQPIFLAPLLALLPELDEQHVAYPSVLGALGELGDARAFDTLTAHVRSTQLDVRLAAVHALRKLGDPRALPHLAPLQHDRTIVGYEDRGGPPYTLGSQVQYAMRALRTANDMPPARPWWKFWAR